MSLQLSQKERMLLEDQKHQEGICIKKYQNYSNVAQDSELKQLFSKLAVEEQQHYDTIDQILKGQEPNMNQGQQAGAQSGKTTQQSPYKGAMGNTDDEVLCSDLLASEKYVSGTYDTGIFEASNPVIRQALQHIQQDEQRHGEELFNYMNSHGMYKVQ
jgi:spore coat protein CotF